jgi:hypothetical protein
VLGACEQPVCGAGDELAATVVRDADVALPLPKAVGTSQTASARTTTATMPASTFLDICDTSFVSEADRVHAPRHNNQCGRVIKRCS